MIFGHLEINRVIKSSWMPAKVVSYLVSIDWLFCLAFLYGWRFLNKISPDWPLTLTTQPCTSKLSDNPDQHSFYGSVNNLLNKNKIMGSLYVSGTLPTYPSPKLAFCLGCEVHVPVRVDVGLGEE